MINRIDDEIIAQSFQDIAEDLEELINLPISAGAEIDKFISEIRKIQKYIRTSSYKEALNEAVRLKAVLEEQRKHLENLKKKMWKSLPTLKLLLELTKAKDEQSELIRMYYGRLGSLITSLDWQSPSFSSSLYSHAGKQTGKIKGMINDYKRDVHMDEKGYEEKFLREYIDAPFKFGIHTYMTSSGQAAFTTILNFLLMEGKITGKVLVGKSSYFQYKQLLIGALKDKIIEIDERNTYEILKIIKEEKPSCIFLDSLCNAKDIPVPDLSKIIDFLIKEYKKEIYLVIDNTCLTIAFQPFRLLLGKTRRIHLIIFESLMKYHHLGLDRATGGIIIAWGQDTQKLFEYRKHSGTNITDSSVYVFPSPSRFSLERRFSRLQRNAFLLSSSLQNHLGNKPNKHLSKIVYPGKGSFFNLEFKKQNIRKYKKFIEIIISEARKRNIQVVGGTSFGLNHTRIYLTSLWTKFGDPFVRVSAGTENRYQLEIIKEVFKSAIDKIGQSFI